MNGHEMPRNFKIVIIGDGGVGKTTFVTRHKSGEYIKRYDPTVGANVHSLPFYTNYGEIVFTCWDTAGQERNSGLRDGYYVDAHGGIIMFDLTARITYQNLANWYTDLTRICPDIPIIVCGNKADIRERAVKPRQITFHHKRGLKYCDLSAKSNYNFERPFLMLARALTGKNDLVFVAQPALEVPEVGIDRNLAAQYEREMESLGAGPLPDAEQDEF
eukprot:GHVN01072616.1.p1 GENE.GHVN01072616.1~~GHVN01072616.1.p1  ORF type:complete len:217 (-),score=6.37 GHVN01072616.1:119-769(-)